MRRVKFYLKFLIVCSFFLTCPGYTVEPDCPLSGVLNSLDFGIIKGELRGLDGGDHSNFGLERDHDIVDLFRDFQKFKDQKTDTPPSISGKIEGYFKLSPLCDFEFNFHVKSLSIEKRTVLPDKKLTDPVDHVLREGETITEDTINRLFREFINVTSNVGRPVAPLGRRIISRADGITQIPELRQDFFDLSSSHPVVREHRRTTVKTMGEQLNAMLRNEEPISVTEGNRICCRINIEDGEFFVFNGFHYPGGKDAGPGGQDEGKAVIIRIRVSGYVKCCCPKPATVAPTPTPQDQPVPPTTPEGTSDTVPTEEEIGTGGGAGGASGPTESNVTSSSNPSSFREQKEKAFGLAPGSITVNPNVTVSQSEKTNGFVVTFTSTSPGFDNRLFISARGDDPLTPFVGVETTLLTRGDNSLYVEERDGSLSYRLSTAGSFGIFADVLVKKAGATVTVNFTINDIERGSDRIESFLFHMQGADGSVSGAHFFNNPFTGFRFVSPQ